MDMQQIDAIVLPCDNQSCMAIAKNLVFHAQTKHIEIQYHYLCELIEDGAMELVFDVVGGQRHFECLDEGRNVGGLLSGWVVSSDIVVDMLRDGGECVNVLWVVEHTCLSQTKGGERE